jgi:hypothetical protein
MANTTKVAKATTSITSTTKDNLLVLPRKIQTEVNTLREARNIAKQSKELGDTARDAILDFVGKTATTLIGTDAKGKRLISVKVVQSSASFDWEALKLEMPEIYDIIKPRYTIERGAGESTLRIDIL